MRPVGFVIILALLMSFSLVGVSLADNSGPVQTSSPEDSDPDDFYSPPLGGEGCTVPDLIS